MMTFSYLDQTYRYLLIALCSLWLWTNCFAATEKPEMMVIPVSAELLDSKIKETEANNGLDAVEKANLLKYYRKAQSDIEAIGNYQVAAKRYGENQQQVMEETESLRHSLTKSSPIVTEESLGMTGPISLGRVEQLLLKLQASRSSQQAKLTDIDLQLEQQLTRPTQLHQRMADAKRELEEIAELSSRTLTGQSSALTSAKEWSQQTTKLRLDAEIESINQELITQPNRMELLQVKRDMLARELAAVNQGIALAYRWIGRQRKTEADRAMAHATAVQKDVAGKHPVLQAIADENARLTQQILSSGEKLDGLNILIEEQKSRFKQIDTDFKSAKQKMDMAGLSPTLGRVLMRQRRQLEELKRDNSGNADLEKTTVDVSLRQMRDTESRRDLSDLTLATEHRLRDQPDDVKAHLNKETKTLLNSQRELLDKAIALDGNLLRRLVELDFAQRQLMELITVYDEFLAEKLLWIRSAAPIGLELFAQLPWEMKQLLRPDNFGELMHSLVTSTLRKPILLIGTPLVLVLLWFSPALYRKVMQTGVLVNDLVRDRFQYTGKALGYGFLRALSWPLLTALLGLQLTEARESLEFIRETARFLVMAAPVFFLLRFFWILCEPKGVAEKHFEWSTAATKLLRNQTKILMLTLLPTAYVVTVASSGSLGSDTLGLSRLAFVAMMLSLSHYFFRLFRNGSAIIEYLTDYYAGGILLRTRMVWYPLAVATPVVLAVMALTGYYYTAGVLTRSLVNSLLLVMAVIVIYEAVIRWLLVKLKIARRAAATERWVARSMEAESVEPAERLPPVGESRLDLAAIDADTRKLIAIMVQLSLLVGYWMIWSSVFPAFAGLDGITLWQQTVSVGGEQQLQAITLQHLATAVIVAVVTAVVAKSLPSLLNIIMMQQLAVNKGTRYAYETLTRYLVIGIGLVVIFSSIGGSWSEIQWLVAALGVGIGFGLQEIIANFISGVIILFERPIRVGDVVTVGDVSGVVTRIRIRATTITNWDRQELLVPNKEFITGHLLNWSLSDSIIRSTIDVGIAYGSDVDKALSLLEEVAVEHEKVLTDPSPLMTFDNFGESALNLKMRFYLPSIDNRMKTLSEIHQMINSKFRAAGIEISFPQRDIHLDTLKPLEIKIHRDERNNAR